MSSQLTATHIRQAAALASPGLARLRRISVSLVLGAAMLVPMSVFGQAADARAIRIVPATKLRAPSLATDAGQRSVQVAALQPAKPAPAPADERLQAGSDGLQIVPALPGSVAPPGRPSYAQVYRSIPFSRAEYDANPSYRHETTMSLLFNQLPQMQIIKQQGPPIVREYGYITPYRYDWGYGAMNYNFFYPRPSVYRNY
jgi:hypothetical protein